MSDLTQAYEAGCSALRTAIQELRSSKKDPNEIQLELYSLAFAYANLEAGRCLIDSFKRNNGSLNAVQRGLFEGLGSLAVADAVYGIFHELSKTISIQKRFLRSETNGFLEDVLSPPNQRRIGELLWAGRTTPIPDFLGEDMGAIRTSVRRFADERIVPRAQQIHRENLTVPDSLVRGIRELGCFGLSVPTKYGGTREDEERDAVGMVVVTEELSRGSLGAAGSLITRPEIVVQALLEGGTEEQKQRWLPGIAQGEPLCAVSVTEPGTGSDVASVSLRATKTDDGWRLNGAKTWCTLAGKAKLILVLARTDLEARPPHRGLSLFLVEKPETDSREFICESPGGGRLTGRAIETLGYRGMHSFEMFFDDFLVPPYCLVGQDAGVNKGFYYTMRGFSAGRLQTAARAVGLMQAAYEASLAHCENRVVFGNPLADYPLTMSKLVRMLGHIEGIRQFSYAVTPVVQSEKGQVLASLVKLLACRYAEWVTREAIQLHGGIGYAQESTVSRLFVDARVLSIFEGAEETLAVKVVGKALMDGILA